jgi:hypothetical protein
MKLGNFGVLGIASGVESVEIPRVSGVTSFDAFESDAYPIRGAVWRPALPSRDDFEFIF